FCQIVSYKKRIELFYLACLCKFTDENFNDVIFMDESSIKLSFYSSKKWTNRTFIDFDNGKIGKPKHPLKVHIWGAISRRGTSICIVFDGIMNSEKFQEHLKTGLIPFIKEKIPTSHILYMDNDPKHKMMEKCTTNSRPSSTKLEPNAPMLSQNLNQSTMKTQVDKLSNSQPTYSSLNKTPVHLEQKKLNSISSSNKINFKMKVYSTQTTDLTDEISQPNNNDQKIVKAFGIEILQSDFHSLYNDLKLNDKIINFYLNLLCMTVDKSSFASIPYLLKKFFQITIEVSLNVLKNLIKQI
ncbi:unnamed protein product, partial [Brachionus calyciflorus]